jgi:hypothetical protein
MTIEQALAIIDSAYYGDMFLPHTKGLGEAVRVVSEGLRAAISDLGLCEKVWQGDMKLCALCKCDNGPDCGGCWKLDHGLNCEFEWRGPDSTKGGQGDEG